MNPLSKCLHYYHIRGYTFREYTSRVYTNVFLKKNKNATQNIDKLIEQRVESYKRPGSSANLIFSETVKGLRTDNGQVSFFLEYDPELRKMWISLQKDLETSLMNLDGVKSISTILTPQKKSAATALHKKIPGVKSIVLVASGKGGVGKSTVAVQIALGMKRQGLKVGILDTDIYGPSLKRMLKLSGTPEMAHNSFIPKIAFGLQCFTIGLIIPEDRAVVWRGLMVQKILKQLLWQLRWDDIDCLILDLPPGTGDVPLTLAQQIEIDGVVIVSTPQDIALIDACKALEMFKQLNINILGLIENMAFFTCPHCQHESPIFSRGGVEVASKNYKLPLLGSIPLSIDLRQACDQGEPEFLLKTNVELCEVFNSITRNITDKLVQKLGGCKNSVGGNGSS